MMKYINIRYTLVEIKKHNESTLDKVENRELGEKVK